jgi:hypothetical protein
VIAGVTCSFPPQLTDGSGACEGICIGIGFRLNGKKGAVELEASWGLWNHAVLRGTPVSARHLTDGSGAVWECDRNFRSPDGLARLGCRKHVGLCQLGRLLSDDSVRKCHPPSFRPIGLGHVTIRESSERSSGKKRTSSAACLDTLLQETPYSACLDKFTRNSLLASGY